MSSLRSAKENAAWLAQHQEAPLDPQRRIVDPHHHLWLRERSSYLFQDLALDASGLNVESTVFVECGADYRSTGPDHERPLGETAFAREQAVFSAQDHAAPAIAGIVAFADLRLAGRLGALLEEHQHIAKGLLVGIRHSGSWDPNLAVPSSHSGAPPDLYLDPEFRRGAVLLGRRGLVCDTWQYFHQLAESGASRGGSEGVGTKDEGGLVGLARSAPETTFVMDHCGGPVLSGPYAERRAEVFDQWRGAIDAVAACENVVVKLSGIAMPRTGFGWHLRERPPSSIELAESMAPWIGHCLDAFGEDRSMFASNFPVDKVSCSYTVLWNAFHRLASERDAHSLDKLFADNAKRIYRLDQERGERG